MAQTLTYHPGDSDHCCLKFILVVRQKNQWENLRKVYLDETFTEDYTKFLEKVELATTGNIPQQTSPKKKLTYI